MNIMTDQEKLNKLVNSLGGRKPLANYLGVSYGNIKAMLRKGKKDLPNWGKSMLYVNDIIMSNEREELEQKIINWGDSKNLNNPVKQTLKTLSEAGELADAVCKSELDKSIGLNYILDLVKNGDLDDVVDAIGDIEVCLTILKNQLGLRQTHCLEVAYEEIKDRTGKTVNGTFVKS